MKTILLALLVILGGCTFEPGAGDGDGLGDPPGDDPAADADGDGVADLTDNCAGVPNGAQRDFDRDGIGDACDACPHRPDTGKDADGDGVGDACDPNPAHPGERLLVFEAFYAPIDWVVVLGDDTWQVGGDLLQQPDLTSQHQIVTGEEPPPAEVVIEARLRIDGLSTNPTSRRSTGLVLGFRAVDDYFFCGLAGQGPTSELNAGHVSRDFFGNPQFNYNPAAFGGNATGQWVTLQARTTQLSGSRTRIDCAGARANSTSSTSYEAWRAASGDLGLRTNGTAASFDYVFAVAVPPA